jgi:hypothetical protein
MLFAFIINFRDIVLFRHGLVNGPYLVSTALT